MPISIGNVETTQKTVEIFLSVQESISITLSKDYSSWVFAINKGRKDLTVEDLIEICNLLYSDKIIKENENIRICLNGKESTCIRGINHVSSEILKAVKVLISEKNKN